MGSSFPYGVASFEEIRNEKKFFVDNTRFIPLLEKEGKNLFFTRPPRFGKSLFVDTLAHYYDVKTSKDKFDNLFGGLYVHKNPTDLQGKYHILKLDFSIDVSSKSNVEIATEEVKKNLNDKISSSVEMMVEKYNLPAKKIIKENPLLSLKHLTNYLNAKQSGLMILIDEYDRFANKLMSENMQVYRNMVRGKSGDPLSSPIRSFFETLKSISGNNPNFRTFTVGITPLALPNASGPNTMKDISLNKKYGDIVGFTQKDIDNGLAIAGVKKEYEEYIRSMLKQLLNGYYFIGTHPDNGLFNPTISLKFLELLQNKPEFIYDMIDQNLNYNIWLEVLADKNVATPTSVLDITSEVSGIDVVYSNIATYNYFPIGGSISNKFATNEMLYSGIMDDCRHLYSFLFYHGILTIQPTNSVRNASMKIPNLMRYSEFVPRLFKKMHFDTQYFIKFTRNPDAINMKEFLWSILSELEIMYGNLFDELSLQALLERAFLYIGGLTVEASKRYVLQNKKTKEPDLLFYQKDAKDVYLLELKRVRPNAIEYPEEENNQKFKSKPINWYPSEYEENRIYLMNKSEEQLENFKIRKEYCYQNNNDTSVKQLIFSAKKQLSEYANLLQNEDYMKDKTIHKFVVVQVGYPIIVKKLE